ncbi:MAG: DUF5677 domain-containing protein [Anaerolineae bacterium]
MDKREEQEYVKLLDVLYRVVQALEGEPLDADRRYYDAEGLAAKFFMHAASALYLYRGTIITDLLPPLGINFGDVASVPVVVRAAIEAFLTFHYVFIAPSSDEEREFRYLSWKAGGFADRQRFPILSAEGERVLDDDRRLLDELHNQLQSNPVFQQLRPKEQTRIRKGRWRRHSWKQMGRAAGLAGAYAETMYEILSGFAHSSSLSVLQIKQADTREEQQKLMEAPMAAVKIAMANVIDGYCALFPKARETLLADPEGKALTEIWLELGRQGLERIDEADEALEGKV